LLVQEAYRNIDLEAKKESYYVELAKELTFYKKESLSLKDILNQAKEELKNNV
jgi:hypothetical protein